MNVYMGLNDEEFSVLAPSAQQIRDLAALGFDTHDGDATWSAVRELGGYRTALTITRDWAMASTIRCCPVKTIAVEVCTSVGEAVGLVMDLALDVDMAVTFGALISAELGRAA